MAEYEWLTHCHGWQKVSPETLQRLHDGVRKGCTTGKAEQIIKKRTRIARKNR